MVQTAELFKSLEKTGILMEALNPMAVENLVQHPDNPSHLVILRSKKLQVITDGHVKSALGKDGYHTVYLGFQREPDSLAELTNPINDDHTHQWDLYTLTDGSSVVCRSEKLKIANDVYLTFAYEGVSAPLQYDGQLASMSLQKACLNKPGYVKDTVVWDGLFYAADSRHGQTTWTVHSGTTTYHPLDGAQSVFSMDQKPLCAFVHPGENLPILSV